MGERLRDVVERFRGQALARQDVGYARRVGGQRLGGHTTHRLPHGHDLLRAEEGVARGHHQLTPGRRGRERLLLGVARLALHSVDGVAQRRQQPLAARLGVLAHSEHGDHDVLTRQLHEHVVLLAHEPGQLEPARLGAANVDCET